MQVDPRELLKEFVTDAGKLIDTRAETTETNLQAYLTTQIKTSELKLQKEIQATKAEIKVTNIALKVDIGEVRTEVYEIKTELKAIKAATIEIKKVAKALRTGIAKKLIEHEERLEEVEKATRTQSKH